MAKLLNRDQLINHLVNVQDSIVSDQVKTCHLQFHS